MGEPSVEDTIAILRGLKGRYEAHHKVQISGTALVAAATLSDRYITARFLPDKAIDLIDEAASRLRMEIDSRPVEIDELQRALTGSRWRKWRWSGRTTRPARSGWSLVRDLPAHHADPFDRLLIAQALDEGFTILTSDRAFEAYRVPVAWA